MQNKDIYAVVDLETTRTTAEEGRIIQVAIAFVQNKKIINQFSTLINPHSNIPRNITKLTGITNEMVHGGPSFEDVAITLHAMLAGTVFVAHNVNFDLPFLNLAFERAGLTALKNTAIDTVQLSQILWPTAPGYRLSDLTQYLGFDHERPHQADSDALATAELLIAILQRAATLPMVTLQSLVELPLALARDTKRIFQLALEENQAEPQLLPNQLQVIAGLAIRRFSKPAPLSNKDEYAYPTKKATLEKLLAPSLAYRPQQAKLMNLIYNHYHDLNDVTTPMVLEAPTGMGKTIGYLLPYAYLANEQSRAVVIATPTINLQQQIMHTINNDLNEVLPFEVRGVSLKGRTHFLNLQSFSRSLQVDEGSASLQFIKAQVLVWLTETLTGDLDDLNLNNASERFLKKLTQSANNPAASNFYGHEFWERQEVSAAQAQFLVVNHAYLATYARELTDEKKPFLVIDEAQRLPDAVIDQSRKKLDFDRWRANIQFAHNTALANHDDGLGSILERLNGGKNFQTQLEQTLQELQSDITELKSTIYRRFLLSNQTPPTDGKRESSVAVTDLAQYWFDHRDTVKNIHIQTLRLDDLLDNIMEAFSQLKGAFSLAERQLLADFRRLLNGISNAESQLTGFQQELVDFPDASVFWLTEITRQDENHVILSGGLLHTFDYFKSRIYPYFEPVTLIGATLFTSTKSSYLYDRLNIERKESETFRFGEVFDYENQAELVVANDAPSVNDSNYSSYLAKEIVELSTTVGENTLVLFTSHEMLQDVFIRVQSNPKFMKSNMTVLAQGISGGQQKLLKRMQKEQHLVVLGAASFWEGIDLPDQQVRLVLLARIPFEQPDNIVQKAEEAVLLAAGKQPFYQNTLPKAVIRLRQGVGRLIRTDQDYGVIVIFDSRIVNKRYGKTLQKMLPRTLPQVAVKSEQILQEVTEFFTKHRK